MLTLPAPAKLNLFLHITGQRDDGYHTLQTVFQFLDYGDVLDFVPRQDGKIHVQTQGETIASEDNLVTRAARLLQDKAACSMGADITLTKHLPMGAGLGGGSSDAATTLLALHTLWHTDLTLDQLADLGYQLGADVSVFVRGQASWAEGIGEQLTPMALPELWYLVLIPPCHVSTQEVFSASRLTRDTAPIRIGDYQVGQGHNDCEDIVCERYPEVGQALKWLSGQASARMTGSGSAVFAAFTHRQQAERVAQQAPSTLKVIVAQGVNRSPVQDALAQHTI